MRQAVSTTRPWRATLSGTTRRSSTSSSTATRAPSPRGRNFAIRPRPRPRHPPSDPGSPALLLVSGGTTGTPKLIPRTHDDYVFNATASAQLCRLTADDVYLVALLGRPQLPAGLPRVARRDDGGRHHRVRHRPQPRGRLRRHRAPRRHGHRPGAGPGQTVGASLRVGAGDTEVVAAVASWRGKAGARRCPPDPHHVDPGAAAGVRDGRGATELHPPGRSARASRPHPGPTVVRGRRIARRRRRRPTGGAGRGR